MTAHVYYNHANAKAESDYWFGLFYPLVVQGFNEDDILKKHKLPTLKKRKDAYFEGLDKALSMVGRELSEQSKRAKSGGGVGKQYDFHINRGWIIVFDFNF